MSNYPLRVWIQAILILFLGLLVLACIQDYFGITFSFDPTANTVPVSLKNNFQETVEVKICGNLNCSRHPETTVRAMLDPGKTFQENVSAGDGSAFFQIILQSKIDRPLCLLVDENKSEAELRSEIILLSSARPCR